MDKKFETLVDSAYALINYLINRISIFCLFRIEKFTMVGVDVKGVLVCDKNGLPLTSNRIFPFDNWLILSFYLGKDVSISPGPIARLAELAVSLSGRRTTVCLEHNEK